MVLFSSRSIWRDCCSFEVKFNQKITLNVVLKKSTIFLFSKCIQCHVYKYKYYVFSGFWSFLLRKLECVEDLTPGGTNQRLPAENKKLTCYNAFKTVKSIENVQKTQTHTEAVARSGIEIATTHQIVLFSSRSIWTKFCGFRVKFNQTSP